MSCGLPPITYYRVPDPKSSFRMAADRYVESMATLGVCVAEQDLDFSPATLDHHPSPGTPLAIVHPLFLFRRWRELSFHDIVERLGRRHSILLGMEVADTDRISPRFVQWANHPSIAGIMLPSRFSCHAYRDSGVHTPICRVPHGVMTVAPSARFAYLRQYDCPKVLSFATRDERRKGWDLLRQLIPEVPGCLFVVKASDSGARYFSSYPNVLIINEWLCPADLASLYTYSDLLVSLHRGGGFEMNCAEALGYGLPVLTTRYGCVLDYLTEQNATLVDVARVEAVYPRGGDQCGVGGTADIADAREKLSALLTRIEAAKGSAQESMRSFRTSWGWQAAAKRLIAFARRAARARGMFASE